MTAHPPGTTEASTVDHADAGDLSLRVTVPAPLAEVAGAILMDHLGPFAEDRAVGKEGKVALVFYPSPGAPATPAELLALLPAVLAEPGVLEVESRRVARDWVDGWKEHFRPTVIGTVRVRPPWESPAPAAPTRSATVLEPVAPGDRPVVDVVINPGLGFGTGLHPTTRGTLLLLQDDPSAPRDSADSIRSGDRGPLVDVGTGSGILSIAAAKLGWRTIVAMDNDPAALISARDNAAANDVQAVVEILEADVASADLTPFAGATVLANMTLEPVTMLLRRLSCADIHVARLVVSGILAGSQEERVVGVAAENGLTPARRLCEEGWVSLDLRPVTPGAPPGIPSD
jgi:ribosomal protein L11 methyltransferase